MFAIISNGVIAMLVPAGTAFEWDSVQYPQNWCNLSSPEEKAAIGMVDVVYGQYPNDQYYWISQDAPVYNGTVVEINYTATPKDLFECQMQAVNSLNATAWSILNPTDWMVTKATETRTAVPTDWNNWREAIRLQAKQQRLAIQATKTVDELAALPPVAWAHDPNYVAPAEPK